MADAAVLILYDDERRVLLQHRDAKARKFPNYWAFFGGRLEPGETPEDGARREAREELAYTLTSPALIAQESLTHDGCKYFYAERYNRREPLQLREGQAMRWFALNDAEHLKMVPHHRLILSNLANLLEQA